MAAEKAGGEGVWGRGGVGVGEACVARTVAKGMAGAVSVAFVLCVHGGVAVAVHHGCQAGGGGAERLRLGSGRRTGGVLVGGAGCYRGSGQRGCGCDGARSVNTRVRLTAGWWCVYGRSSTRREQVLYVWEPRLRGSDRGRKRDNNVKMPAVIP